MQPAYYENFEEIQNKYWSNLDIMPDVGFSDVVPGGLSVR